MLYYFYRFLLSSCVCHLLIKFTMMTYSVISSSDGDRLDMMKQKRALLKLMLGFFGGKLPSVKSRLFASYCTSYYGCELWHLTCVQLLDFCTAWRKGVRRFWDLPHTTHRYPRYLLPLLGQCLPVLNEICKMSMNFVSTCLSHTSSLVKYVAHHSIRFELNYRAAWNADAV